MIRFNSLEDLKSYKIGIVSGYSVPPGLKEANLKSLTDVYGTNSNRLKIYKGDICDETFMTNLFEQEHPEWVCHMAARAGVRPSIQDPYIYIHSNIKVRLSSSCFC